MNRTIKLLREHVFRWQMFLNAAHFTSSMREWVWEETVEFAGRGPANSYLCHLDSTEPYQCTWSSLDSQSLFSLFLSPILSRTHSLPLLSLSHYDYCFRLQSSDVEWVESWETCPEGGAHWLWHEQKEPQDYLHYWVMWRNISLWFQMCRQLKGSMWMFDLHFTVLCYILITSHHPHRLLMNAWKAAIKIFVNSKHTLSEVL